MKRITLSLVVLTLWAGQAKAAGGQLSFYAGYLNPGKLSLDNVQAGLQLTGTALYGARAEFDFHRVIGIEENVGFSPKLFNSDLFPAEVSDVRGLLYSSNLVLNLPLGHFVPYVQGGVGFIKPWGTGLKAFDTSFAGSYGGGLKLDRLIGPAGLRFDVRGWTVPDVAGSTLNLLEATGSITFTWGER